MADPEEEQDHFDIRGTQCAEAQMSEQEEAKTCQGMTASDWRSQEICAAEAILNTTQASIVILVVSVRQ